MDLLKIQSFYTSKDNIKEMKRQVIDQKKILAKHIFNKGFVSRIYEELLQLSNKMTIQSKHGEKIWNRHFFREYKHDNPVITWGKDLEQTFLQRT